MASAFSFLSPGVAALVVGATFIATAPIFAVLAHEWGELSPTVSAMWRVLLAAPPFILAAFWQSRRRDADSSGSQDSASAETVQGRSVGTSARPDRAPAKRRVRRLIWFVLPGLIFAADLASWHASMTIISAGLSTLLANLSAVLVPVVAYFVFGERFRRRFVVGACLALLGTGLLMQRPNAEVLATLPGREEDYWLGNALGIATAVWYGSYQLAVKQLRRFARTAATMAWVTSVAGLCLLLAALVLDTPLLPSSPRGWWPVVGMTVGSQIVGQGLIAWGLGRVSAGAAAVILLWQPLAATWLGYLVLGQALSVTQLAGVVPVLSGLLLVARNQKAIESTPVSNAQDR